MERICAEVRHRLPRYARGDLPADLTLQVAAHVALCAACHAEWHRLDPVAATAAYATGLRAPADLAAAVHTAIAQLPLPVRRPPAWPGRARAAAACAAIVAAWSLGGRLGPWAFRLLVESVVAVVGGASAGVAVVHALLRAAGPVAVGAAAAVVCGELALLRHLTRPSTHGAS